jgi:hypothetical protein
MNILDRSIYIYNFRCEIIWFLNLMVLPAKKRVFLFSSSRFCFLKFVVFRFFLFVLYTVACFLHTHFVYLFLYFFYSHLYLLIALKIYSETLNLKMKRISFYVNVNVNVNFLCYGYKESDCRIILIITANCIVYGDFGDTR